VKGAAENELQREMIEVEEICIRIIKISNN
jgi:hypothetical protein